MRYAMGTDWGKAAACIRYRICALPEFAHARSIIALGALEECRGRDVPAMRELGGFSAVVERHIAALPDKYRVNLGSRLLPSTVVDQLRAMVPDLRSELQVALAAAQRAS